MCCYIDKYTTEQFIAKMKKKGKKFFYAYKQLDVYGNALHGEYKFSPGKHEMKRKVVNYNRDFPKGFHFMMKKDSLLRYRDSLSEGINREPIIRIKVYLKDLIGLEAGDDGEGVANAIYIEKSEFERCKFWPEIKIGQLLLANKQGLNIKYIVVEDLYGSPSLLNIKNSSIECYIEEKDLLTEFDSVKVLKQKCNLNAV